MSYVSEVLADSPHTYWDCQDASGLLQDQSGNARHASGSANTGDVTYQADGPFAGTDSIRFSGASGDPWANFTRTPASAVNNITMEWWFYHDTTVANGAGLWINGDFVNDGWYWNVIANEIRVSLAGVAHLAFFVNDLVPNTWHHLVAVRRAGTWEYYYNGAVDTASVSSAAPNTPSSSWLLGNFSTTRSFGCAHVAYYETALSAERILAHYNAALAEREPVGYSRIYGPTHLGTSAADLYTVPSGARVRLRRIHASNPSGSPVDFTLSIGTDAAATRLFDSYNIPAGGEVNENPDHALAAGEKIQGFAGTGSTVVLNIDGYIEPTS